MMKKIKTSTVYRINTKHSGSEKTAPSARGYKYSQSTFTGTGQLLTETRFNEDEEVEEKYAHKYDPQGRLVEEMTYLNADEIAEHKSYERDSEGHISKAFKHYQDGEKDTIHYNRDHQGRLTEKITIDSYHEEEAREIIEYKGDKVTLRKVYEYDELVMEESYTYNSEGNVEGHTKWSNEDENSKYVNEYDSGGNIVSTRKYDLRDKLLSRVDYEYEGGRLAKITEEQPYGTNTTTLRYDDQGNPVEQVEMNQQGEVNNKAVRKFNENNDVSESEVFIHFHGRGIDQHYLLKYEYEYYGQDPA